jgi:hypothetical protein
MDSAPADMTCDPSRIRIDKLHIEQQANIPRIEKYLDEQILESSNTKPREIDKSAHKTSRDFRHSIVTSLQKSTQMTNEIYIAGTAQQITIPSHIEANHSGLQRRIDADTPNPNTSGFDLFNFFEFNSRKSALLDDVLQKKYMPTCESIEVDQIDIPQTDNSTNDHSIYSASSQNSMTESDEATMSLRKTRNSFVFEIVKRVSADHQSSRASSILALLEFQVEERQNSSKRELFVESPIDGIHKSTVDDIESCFNNVSFTEPLNCTGLLTTLQLQLKNSNYRSDSDEENCEANEIQLDVLSDNEFWSKHPRCKSGSTQGLPPTPLKNSPVGPWLPQVHQMTDNPEELGDIMQVKVTNENDIPNLVAVYPTEKENDEMNEAPTATSFGIPALGVDMNRKKEFVSRNLRRSSSDGKNSLHFDQGAVNRRQSYSQTNGQKLHIGYGSPSSMKSMSPMASPIDGPSFFSGSTSPSDSSSQFEKQSQSKKEKPNKPSFYSKFKSIKKKDTSLDENMSKEQSELKIASTKPILKKPTIQFKENDCVELIEFKRQPKTRKRGQSIRNRAEPSLLTPSKETSPIIPESCIPDPTISKTRFDDCVLDIHLELKTKHPTLYQKIKAFFD